MKIKSRPLELVKLDPSVKAEMHAAYQAMAKDFHDRPKTITVSQAIEVLTALEDCTHPDARLFVKDQGIDISDFLVKP